MQRKHIVYTITYLKDNKKDEFSCTIYSLEKIKEKIIRGGAQILSVIEHPLKNDKTKSSNLDLANKYKTFLDNKNRIEIIKQIKLDLINQYENIWLIELDILSNNIYDFCCLMVHHVPEDEIGKYIIYKNNYYCNILSDEYKSINLDNNTLKYFTKLKDKYINIISEKNN